MIILSFALMGVFAVLALSHLVVAYYRIIRRRPGFSSVPLVNGLIGALGIGLFPDPEVSRFWWVALLIDWGCVPLLVEVVVWKLLHGWTEPGGDGGAK